MPLDEAQVTRARTQLWLEAQRAAGCTVSEQDISYERSPDRFGDPARGQLRSTIAVSKLRRRPGLVSRLRARSDLRRSYRTGKYGHACACGFLPIRQRDADPIEGISIRGRMALILLALQGAARQLGCADTPAMRAASDELWAFVETNDLSGWEYQAGEGACGQAITRLAFIGGGTFHEPSEWNAMPLDLLRLVKCAFDLGQDQMYGAVVAPGPTYEVVLSLRVAERLDAEVRVEPAHLAQTYPFNASNTEWYGWGDPFPAATFRR